MNQDVKYMTDLFQVEYFSILDTAWAVIFIIILFLIAKSQKKRYESLEYFEYYNRNIVGKVFLSLVYALYYIAVVDGGDTLAYWDGGVKLNNLFWKSPTMYFEELFSDPDMVNYFKYDAETGFPPGWIYREKESWFISKMMSIFAFFTFKSYIVTTFILAYFSSVASWKLFELVHSFKLNSNRHIAFGVLFVPSVGFWCTGITKDTIVLFSSIMIVYNAFQILSLDKKSSIGNLLWIIFYGYLLLQIRSFMVSTILVSLAFTYSARLANKYRQNKFTYYSIRTLSLVVGLLFFNFQSESLLNSDKLVEAAAIQKDFATNDTYEGKKYDLGITDYSAEGMLSAFVPAVIAGFYRPFIWESLSVTLILNGIEGAYFMYLTFVFFRRNALKKINLIRKHEFFIFAFFFCLLMAYMAGLTSGLLGVLVRFKAPLIPFLVLLLTIDLRLFDKDTTNLLDNSDKEEPIIDSEFVA
jgi:hypothetical protein